MMRDQDIPDDAGPDEDWYERRHELEEGMVFVDLEGDLVMLDRRVPGDGTNWYVAVRCGRSWSYDDTEIHPGDLRERVSDPENQDGLEP